VTAVEGAEVEVELATRPPFAAPQLFEFLAARAVPGIEHWDGARFHRALSLPGGHALARMRSDSEAAVMIELELTSAADRDAAIEAVRRLLDLDADPVAVDGVLAADPVLAPFVAATPGLRVAGSVDPFETAVRAVIGQQISVRGARTVAGRIVASVGAPLQVGATATGDAVTNVFPTPAALAAIDPALLPMPMSRRRTIVELATRVADGRIELRAGAEPDAVASGLLAVPGIGPWTAGYVRMRGLGDPDVFLPTDLGVKLGMRRLGVGAAHSDRWRPWRTYAMHHVWVAAGLPP
jgi:AraC family transcriptional regulator of adaptative response / DNA-3-methyladenine glycosylase II